MEPIALLDWNDVGRVCVIEKEFGFHFRRKGESEQLKLRGWACEIRKDIYAVYVVGRSLRFCANSREWECASGGPELSYRRFFGIEKFRVREDGVKQFSRCYANLGVTAGTLRDPTFDAIDQDRTYFLQWCTKRLADPEARAALIERWQDGM